MPHLQLPSHAVLNNEDAWGHFSHFNISAFIFIWDLKTLLESQNWGENFESKVLYIRDFLKIFVFPYTWFISACKQVASGKVLDNFLIYFDKGNVVLSKCKHAEGKQIETLFFKFSSENVQVVYLRNYISLLKCVGVKKIQPLFCFSLLFVGEGIPFCAHLNLQAFNRFVCPYLSFNSSCLEQLTHRL